MGPGSFRGSQGGGGVGSVSHHGRKTPEGVGRKGRDPVCL